MYYDTTVVESTNECDFVIVLYKDMKRDLQRAECENFKYSNIHISKFIYSKGDTMSFNISV